MDPVDGKKRALRVAVTGASGGLGRILLPRLQADPGVERILVLDRLCPPGEKLDFRAVDLIRQDAENTLVEAFAEESIDVVYHLAFPLGPRRSGTAAHELEVVGSLHVLGAAARARVPRLVVASFTALYGARSQHPAWLTEDAPLLGCPESRFISDKVEVETQVRDFRAHHPDTEVLLLRLAPLAGPRIDTPVTRMLRRRVVPTLLGFDPLWQLLHEEDASAALHLALRAGSPGEYNIVGLGVASLSSLIVAAGARALPLPTPLARAALRALHGLGAVSLHVTLLDYVHYSWVADGARARKELGFVARYDARETAATLRRS